VSFEKTAPSFSRTVLLSSDMTTPRASVVDIFCGVGGLTHGFVLEKFNVVAGLDSDTSCEFAYERNNKAKFIGKKIEEIDPREIADLYPRGDIKILVGCAPCQPFSSNNVKRPETDKWKLLYAFADLIEAVKPDILSMENVLQLKTFQQGRVFKDFVGRLEVLGYHVTDFRANCPEYGVPQNRRRLVLFGSKFGPVKLVEGTHGSDNYRTVEDVIGGLEPVEAGGASGRDLLHRSAKLSAINEQRIRASQPGGTWQDWDKKLRLTCHTKKKGRTKGHTALSVYGRMEWDKIAPTLTTNFFNLGSGRYGHPDQDRAITLREGALLQTFPRTYQFVESEEDINFNKLGRQIGNAVPVKLGQAIARSISSHITQVKSTAR
jgi:DNA (cytosine-5)-methyltransferase 1